MFRNQGKWCLEHGTVSLSEMYSKELPGGDDPAEFAIS